MNMPTNVLARTTTRSLLIAGVLVGSAFSSASAAPPIDHLSHGLEKVGDFFFKIARSLEQGGFADDDGDYSITYDARRRDPIRVEVIPRRDSSIIVPPGYRPSTEIAPYPPRPRSGTSIPPQGEEGFVPPRFQPHPQPQFHPPDVNRQAPREDLSVPLDRQSDNSINRSETIEPRRAPDSSLRSGPFEPPKSQPQQPQKEGNTDHGNKASPQSSTSSSELKYATPVPGKHGFVYPPGIEQDPKNMLDVRDFTPGQKVKDPRSGKVFLVP